MTGAGSSRISTYLWIVISDTPSAVVQEQDPRCFAGHVVVDRNDVDPVAA
jgi:hypothetical protein